MAVRLVEVSTPFRLPPLLMLSLSLVAQAAALRGVGAMFAAAAVVREGGGQPKQGGEEGEGKGVVCLAFALW